MAIRAVLTVLLLASFCSAGQSGNRQKANIIEIYHLNEGEGSLASGSLGKSTQAVITGAAWVTGKFGKSLSFDGTNDNVRIGGQTASYELTQYDQMLVSGWIKGPITANTTVISKLKLASGYRGWELSILTDLTNCTGFAGRMVSCILYWTTNTGMNVQSSSTFSTSAFSKMEWYHIGFTYNGNGSAGSDSVRLFYNGKYAGKNCTNSETIGGEMTANGREPFVGDRFFNVNENQATNVSIDDIVIMRIDNAATQPMQFTDGVMRKLYEDGKGAHSQ